MKKIKNFFKLSLVSVFAACATGCGSLEHIVDRNMTSHPLVPLHPEKPTEPVVTQPSSKLTAEEVALANSIFGTNINPNAIVKSFYSKDKKDAARTYSTTDIRFYGDKYYSTNYACEKDMFNYGAFVHELAHVWQFTVKEPKLYIATNNFYSYSFTNGCTLTDYDREQQACMVEDYARYFLKGGATHRLSAPTAENLEKLKETVEKQFPDAKNARLKAEQELKSRAIIISGSTTKTNTLYP